MDHRLVAFSGARGMVEKIVKQVKKLRGYKSHIFMPDGTLIAKLHNDYYIVNCNGLKKLKQKTVNTSTGAYNKDSCTIEAWSAL